MSEPIDTIRMFRVAIEQERGVIGIGELLSMQLLEVAREMVDMLRVEKLDEHVNGRHTFDRASKVPS